MSDEETTSYEVTPLNKVNRMPNRGKYDHQTVHSIFRSAPIAHVSFSDEFGQPHCIPMIASLEDAEESEDGEVYVYLHGHAGGRLMKVFEEEGVRCCVTATSVDGIVLSLTPFHHSLNYRSSILYCVSAPLPPWSSPSSSDTYPTPSDLLRISALKRVTSQIVSPDRWAVAREPTRKEYESTGVVRVRVESGSAKVRSGGPKDEKKDLTNSHLTSTCWSGHVPLKLVPGTPVPSEVTLEKDFPNGPTEDVLGLLKRFEE